MKIITNPDKEYVKEIKAQLKANNHYCPCRLQKTPDTKRQILNVCAKSLESRSLVCATAVYT